MKKDKKQTHSHAAHRHNVILREREGGSGWLSSTADRKPTVMSTVHRVQTALDGGFSRVTVYLPPAETLTFGLETFSAARFFRRLQQWDSRDSITHRRETTLQTHTVSWLHMSFSTANNTFDIPQVRSISCCRLQVSGVRSQLHNYSSYSEFSTMVAYWVSFSSCSSSVPTCPLAGDALEVQSSTLTVIVTN